MGCSRSWAFAASLVVCIATLHILIAPYTKIEERFILHAIHDTWVAPPPEQWDYRQFPDPVPHSFAGVKALALASVPLAWLSHNSAQVELAVRWTLALINVGALLFLFQNQSPFALLLTATQFHFLFWIGRTTHNAIVLAPVLIALRLLFLDRPAARSAQVGIALLTFCAALLRSELVGILAPSTLWVLWTGTLSLPSVVATGLMAGLAALGYGTIWDRPAWATVHEPTLPFPLFLPEWEAVVFNIVHGNSKAWGTMPVHW